MWWHTPVSLAFKRLRREELKFEVRLSYIVRLKERRGKKRNIHINN
jgi:hypothetical protein